MKKNIIKTTMIAAIAIFAGYNMYQSNMNSKKLSDVMLANVEALAQSEGFVDDGTCYNSISTAAGSQVRYCGTCTFIPNSIGDWGSKRKCW